MLRRGALTISMLSNSTMLGGWCRPRRRLRRRKSSTIRLGNKRRGFCLASKPVVQWGVMMGPLRMLKKIIMDMAPNGQLIEAYYWSLIPFLRPQLFPLCWLLALFTWGGFFFFFFLVLFFLFLLSFVIVIRSRATPLNWTGKLHIESF